MAAAEGIAMTAVTEEGTAVDITPEGNDCALINTYFSFCKTCANDVFIQIIDFYRDIKTLISSLPLNKEFWNCFTSLVCPY